MRTSTTSLASLWGMAIAENNYAASGQPSLDEYDKQTARFDRLDEGVPYGMNPYEVGQHFGRYPGMGYNDYDMMAGAGNDRMRYGGGGGGGGGGGILGVGGTGIFGNGFGYSNNFMDDPHSHHHHHHHHFHDDGAFEGNAWNLYGDSPSVWHESNSYLETDVHAARPEPPAGVDTKVLQNSISSPNNNRYQPSPLTGGGVPSDSQGLNHLRSPTPHHHHHLRGNNDRGRDFLNGRMGGINSMPLNMANSLGNGFGGGNNMMAMNQRINTQIRPLAGGVGLPSNGQMNRMVNPYYGRSGGALGNSLGRVY